MSKYKVLILTLLLIYVGCAHNHITDLPELEKVDQIEISNGDSSYKIDSKDKIDNIIKSLEEVRSTKRQSTNDYPNVDEYITIGIQKDDNVHTYYIYDKDDKFYIEEPYVGIWELDDEIYDKLTKKLFDY